MRKASFGSTQLWIDGYQYDSSGRVIAHATPAATTGLSEASPDLVGWGKAGGNIADNSGLVEWTSYEAVSGRVENQQISQGEMGAKMLVKTATYSAHTTQ